MTDEQLATLCEAVDVIFILREQHVQQHGHSQQDIYDKAYIALRDVICDDTPKTDKESTP